MPAGTSAAQHQRVLAVFVALIVRVQRNDVAVASIRNRGQRLAQESRPMTGDDAARILLALKRGSRFDSHDRE
jgi:hypothetical protein